MPGDYDYGDYNIPPVLSGSSTVVVIPQSSKQATTANLANLASIDFDFNIEFNPLFDMMIACDVALIVRVFCRQGAADTFRQLGADYIIPAGLVAQTQPFVALRVPGDQARVRVLNNSGGPSATLSAQVHARSL